MIADFTVKVDGVSLEFFSGYGGSYEWIVDSYRNENDYAVITNPTQKRTLELKADRLSKAQFRLLMQTVGRKDLRHSVQLYDEQTGALKTYQMYNSTLKYQKARAGGETIYTGVSFSLIER